MSVLREGLEEIYGLLVEDGQIAIGTLVAFAICALVSAVGGESLRNAAGPLLFVLLMSLLLVNVYTVGRKARERRG